MTDKELRHLGRSELIEMLYEAQKQNEEKDAQIAELRAQLDDRTLRLSQCGSIAEAALQLNGVFDAAQAAAAQYLDSIRAAEADNEQREKAAEQARQKSIRAAKAEAKQIVEDANAQARKTLEEAERGAEEKWKRFEERANELINAHAELQAMVRDARG